MFSSHPKANKPRFCNYKDQGLGRCWKILTSPGDTEVPKAEWENQDQCKITNPNRFNSYATCSSLYLPSSYTRAPNAVFTALPCLQHQPGSALHALFWRTIPPKPSQQLDNCCLLTSQLIAGWSWLVKTTAGHGKFKAGQTDSHASEPAGELPLAWICLVVRQASQRGHTVLHWDAEFSITFGACLLLRCCSVVPEHRQLANPRYSKGVTVQESTLGN